MEVDAMSETHELSAFTKELLQEQIALRAYRLYASRGCLDGFDLQDWLQAEEEVLSQLDHQAVRSSAAAS
jgi:hypothetical protein